MSVKSLSIKDFQKTAFFAKHIPFAFSKISFRFPQKPHRKSVCKPVSCDFRHISYKNIKISSQNIWSLKTLSYLCIFTRRERGGEKHNIIHNN